MLQIIYRESRNHMYKLKEKTKEMASFIIGINSDTFINFDYDDEINFLNSSDKKECRFLPNDDSRIAGRGNPLLARNEFLPMDEVNKELFGE